MKKLYDFKSEKFSVLGSLKDSFNDLLSIILHICILFMLLICIIEKFKNTESISTLISAVFAVSIIHVIYVYGDFKKSKRIEC